MNKKVMKLASRGKRLGAYAIDKIIPFILGIIEIAALINISYSLRIFNSYGYGYNSMGGGYSGTLAAIVVCTILFLAYAVVQVFFYSKSQSIGKAILGLMVVDTTRGEPVGVWKMILREWFAKRASEVIFCLGFLWILIDDKNRGWHDKIMDTYVIDIKESERIGAGSIQNCSSVRSAEQTEQTEQPLADTEEKDASAVERIAGDGECAEPVVEDEMVIEPIESEE